MQFLEIAIRYGLYLLTLVFAWIAVSPLIVPSIKMNRVRSRFRGDFQVNIEIKKPNGRWYRQLELFLITTIGYGTPFIVFSFLSLTVFLFALSFLFLRESGTSLTNALLGSAVVGGLPVFVLFMRRQNIRISSSYEGDGLITELIAQYKLNYMNMVEAIDKTIPRLKGYRHTRRALTRLSLGLKENGKAEDIERLTQEFAYAFATNWAELLANNIYMAIIYRDDVREALQDILSELTSIKAVNEKGNRDNIETFFMIKYVAPLGYIASVYGLLQYFGFSWNKFIEYQFENPLGVKGFIFVVVTFILNFVLYVFFKKPRNDI